MDRFVCTAYARVRKEDTRCCQIVCSWPQLCCPSTRAPPVQAPPFLLPAKDTVPGTAIRRVASAAAPILGH